MSIYISPFSSNDNNYINNMVHMLMSQYTVKELPTFKNLVVDFKNNRINRKDTIILNWYEDVSSRRGFGFFVSSIYLILLKILCPNIIWVRHNYRPHDHKNLLRYKFQCFLLRLLSKYKVTHRPVLNYTYIPHPMYTGKYSVSRERDIEYLYFGQMKSYKGLAQLLNSWNIELPLYMVGKCHDKVLEKELKSIIKRRHLKVTFRNEFIELDELESLLSRTKSVVIPHVENSMIVSGIFYHAASMGVNIKFRERGAFYDYLSKNFSFVSLLTEDINRVSPECVYEELLESCSDELILEGFRKMIVTSPPKLKP